MSLIECALKGLLTAAAVTAAILTARRCDVAVGGAVAGLPIVTAPWLVSVAERDGAAFAAEAATASIAACIAMAVFAAGYARFARRAGIVGTTTIALLLAATVVPLVRIASTRLDAAVASAAVACTLALLALPVEVAVRTRRRPGIATPLVAASAGVVGAASTGAAALLGPFAAALFTALPVVGFATLVGEHRTNGAPAAVHCLRGYLAGLYGKVVFGLVFAVAVRHESAWAAVVAATLAGCTTTFLVLRRASSRSLRDDPIVRLLQPEQRRQPLRCVRARRKIDRPGPRHPASARCLPRRRDANRPPAAATRGLAPTFPGNSHV